ncbi:MAG: hypothetical protein ACKOES_08410, partial [Planctomycetaceae bacterium]
WQHEYEFAEPLRLPAGTTLKASAWYDNSTKNKSNPDPSKDVWWGDQTWEEMMIGSTDLDVPVRTWKSHGPGGGAQRRRRAEGGE